MGVSCRFENRLTGQALALHGLRERIVACSASELPAVFKRIESARNQGYWIALLLNYELGEWLEPALLRPENSVTGGGRLTALVFKQGEPVSIQAGVAHTDPIELSMAPRIARSRYLNDIELLRDGIARGEFYQVNHTFPIDIRTSAAPRDLYESIAARHPVAHAAYIQDGERTILSFSPELFVARQGDTLTVRPMKGTAPRHTDPDLDFQSGQDLLHSEKNRAENLMIVDLLRNDLGRLASPGSVRVRNLFSLERYPSVWTLTSTVTAQAPDKSLSQVLHALFPCGSVTGAPKIAAMRKIQQMEAAPRGIYCGSVGWLAPSGDFSLNVAIRTIEIHGTQSCVFGVGGGIVADSDPAREWEECQWKARILRIPAIADPVGLAAACVNHE